MSSTEYQIAVFAVSVHTASEGLRGTETTRVYFIPFYFSTHTATLRWLIPKLGRSGRIDTMIDIHRQWLS